MTEKRLAAELKKFGIGLVGIEVKKFKQPGECSGRSTIPAAAWKGVFRHAGISYALGEQVTMSGMSIPIKEVRSHLFEMALNSVPRTILVSIDREHSRLRNENVRVKSSRN